MYISCTYTYIAVLIVILDCVTKRPLYDASDYNEYMDESKRYKKLKMTTQASDSSGDGSGSYTHHTQQQQQQYIRERRGSNGGRVRDSIDLIQGKVEVQKSKFYFVDLAGSERLKRTHATGQRMREGEQQAAGCSHS